MLVLPAEGLPILMRRMWLVPELMTLTPVLMLWSNDIDPDAGTTLGDLVPATFTGYNPIVLAPPGWSVPVVAAEIGSMTWPATPQAWVCSGAPQSIFGHAIFDPAEMKLLLIERWDAPRDVTVGGTLRLTVEFTERTYTPCP